MLENYQNSGIVIPNNKNISAVFEYTDTKEIVKFPVIAWSQMIYRYDSKTIKNRPDLKKDIVTLEPMILDNSCQDSITEGCELQSAVDVECDNFKFIRLEYDDYKKTK